MNEEEKEAIKRMKIYIENSERNRCDYQGKMLSNYMETAIYLIDKQQKEIEELIEACNKYNDMKYFAMAADRYISKDKIKAKIKELENIKEQTTNDCMFELLARIDILKELLGE